MKKKLALLLAALLLFGSAACGKTETADDTQQEIQTECRNAAFPTLSPMHG